VPQKVEQARRTGDLDCRGSGLCPDVARNGIGQHAGDDENDDKGQDGEAPKQDRVACGRSLDCMHLASPSIGCHRPVV
jgi:hypothetical protein